MEDREEVWEEVSLLLNSYPEPCAIVGDLNQIDTLDDKLGGVSCIRGRDVFLHWKIENGLVDIPFTGPRFMWSNKREGDDLIMEHLDQGFANDGWLNLYPTSFILNLPIFILDHSLIPLFTDPQSQKIRRNFKIDE